MSDTIGQLPLPHPCMHSKERRFHRLLVSEDLPGLATFSKLLDKLLIMLLITSARLPYFSSPPSSDSIAWHLPSVFDPKPRAAEPCVKWE
ncbi:hypothetical protein CgunFtcFv8_009611 [Champsocephalus gunnari]|uniref:Uncharacterized protein n=2 Tax=Champsocephalus TaxID=52236 RepID=A0AAN8C2M0_CHAGU|nr:hypothetical protein CgunFtcFv8_009611 [Champsocephalus gunnari]